MPDLVHSSQLSVHSRKESVNREPRTVNRKPKGFTLIELLVVIAVIGVLVAFVVAGFSLVREKARDAKRKSELNAIKTALALYASDHNGQYPPSGTGTEYTTSSATCSTTWIPELVPTYIKALPCDPSQAGIITTLAQLFQNIRDALEDQVPIQNVYAADETPLQAVLGTGYSNGTGTYTMGYRFRPTVNGQITKLWCWNNGTKNVRLYSDSGTLMTSTDVNCNSAWGSANITPINVTAGTYYVVAVYVGASSAYFYKALTVPVTSGNIYIESRRYYSGDGFPSSTDPTNVYGLADITFSTGGGSAPTVTTSAATSITSSGATLNGSANPNGAATTGWFRYSTTNPGTCNDTFGTRAPSSGGDALGSGTSAVAYPESISGLTASTTYYFCAIASNASGTSPASNILSLTTTAPVPTPTPTPAPTPSPTPSPASSPSPNSHYFGYFTVPDRKSYVLWSRLENENDPEVYTSDTAKCRDDTAGSPPSDTNYNFCVQNP